MQTVNCALSASKVPVFQFTVCTSWLARLWRKLQQDVLECAASLHGEAVLVGGDWNMEPEEFPIDLARGDALSRPLVQEGGTAPTHLDRAQEGPARRLDWFLVSPSKIGCFHRIFIFVSILVSGKDSGCILGCVLGFCVLQGGGGNCKLSVS